MLFHNLQEDWSLELVVIDKNILGTHFYMTEQSYVHGSVMDVNKRHYITIGIV